MNSEKRYFQWINGARRGEVLIFDKIEEEDNMVFVSFTDKSRCNEDLILPINQINNRNMLMAEVENPNNIWVFKEKWVGREEERWEKNQDGASVCVQPFIAGRKEIIQIPPKKSVAKFGEISKQPTVATVASSISDHVDHSNDPVWITLSKSKKTEMEIELNLTITAPSKELFNIIKENFDEGDKKTLNYIIENINIDEIKKSLIISFKKFYNEIEKFENKTIHEKTI